MKSRVSSLTTLSTSSFESRVRCTSYLRLNDTTKLLDLPTDNELFDQIILPTSRYNNKQQLNHHFQQIKHDNHKPIDDKHSLLYLLNTPLLPNTLYSIRISHTAVSPADFTIRFHPNHNFVKSSGQQDQPKTGRDLLNTEIFKFRTNDNGFPDLLLDKQCIVVVIESFNTGITPAHINNDKNRLVSFNLILETESIGVPPEIPRMVSIIIVSILFMAFFIVRLLFPRMKGFQLLV
ncbi:hypothetical protein PPL_07353 [Heterostelium album PN500]|uniref:Uncharacterized protein n=1 Tax=Heterostelium pallidum (strain ATCC 26659 / Pp 5 / PN500) TaxID=670386 RepID=D3BF36_HETP5|nr:hypothetical protein PPL_07353 [Heterostelium album PN500]EFA80517.1 hypothetical protein PPL_07353 [Heterostelium album PN500]|eukprot:XP_020432637.1 hypothetical protein PPL_07353 [Heterostelium album PN500]